MLPIKQTIVPKRYTHIGMIDSGSSTLRIENLKYKNRNNPNPIIWVQILNVSLCILKIDNVSDFIDDCGKR